MIRRFRVCHALFCALALNLAFVGVATSQDNTQNAEREYLDMLPGVKTLRELSDKVKNFFSSEKPPLDPGEYQTDRYPAPGPSELEQARKDRERLQEIRTQKEADSRRAYNELAVTDRSIKARLQGYCGNPLDQGCKDAVHDAELLATKVNAFNANPDFVERRGTLAPESPSIAASYKPLQDKAWEETRRKVDELDALQRENEALRKKLQEIGKEQEVTAIKAESDESGPIRPEPWGTLPATPEPDESRRIRADKPLLSSGGPESSSDEVHAFYRAWDEKEAALYKLGEKMEPWGSFALQTRAGRAAFLAKCDDRIARARDRIKDEEDKAEADKAGAERKLAEEEERKRKEEWRIAIAESEKLDRAMRERIRQHTEAARNQPAQQQQVPAASRAGGAGARASSRYSSVCERNHAKIKNAMSGLLQYGASNDLFLRDYNLMGAKLFQPCAGSDSKAADIYRSATAEYERINRYCARPHRSFECTQWGGTGDKKYQDANRNWFAVFSAEANKALSDPNYSADLDGGVTQSAAGRVTTQSAASNFSGSCKSAYDRQEVEFRALNRRIMSTESVVSRLQLTMEMLSQRMSLLNQLCKDQPQYAEYASTKESFDGAQAACRGLASTPSACDHRR